jgi:hypothetical protein
MYFYVPETTQTLQMFAAGRSTSAPVVTQQRTTFHCRTQDDAPENRQNAAQAVVPCSTCRRATALVVAGTAEHEPG